MSDPIKFVPLLIAGAFAVGYCLGHCGLPDFLRRRGAKYLATRKYSPEVMEYAMKVGMREHPVLQELREVTSTHPRAGMMSSPDEANFLGLLVKIMNAKKVIEVGVFTGFGTLSIALHLPNDSKLIALDISDEFVSVGKPYWKKAGVDHKIELKIAPAMETLAALLKNGEAETFDFAFVDADKPNYVNYFEALLPLLRRGGVIVFDNVLWHGAVVDEKATDPNTIAIRKINAILRDDPRVEIAMLVAADGITMVRKL